MENTISKKTKNTYIYAAAGQGAIYAMISSWLLRFYTDVLGLGLTFVMALMWVAKILNAFADPVVGVIVDKTQTKQGKMRPYLMFTPFIVSLLSILLFIDFGITSNVGKCVYASIIYLLWGIAYSFADVPFWGLPCVLTDDGAQRDKLFSLAKFLNGLGGALPTLVVSLLISDSLLGLQKGIFFSALGLIIISCIPFSLIYFNSKEIVHKNTDNNMKLSKQIKLIAKNKILLLVILSGILGFGRYMVQAAYTYAADYVFITNSDFINSYRQVIGFALIGIGMFPTMILAPKLINKFSYKVLTIVCGLFAAAIMVLFYFVEVLTNYNFYLAMLFLFISGAPLGLFNIIVTSIIGECVDYLEWKENVRLEGMSASMGTFIAKVGNAISAGLVPLVLSISGYVKNVEQTDSTKKAILMVISLIPAGSMLLSAIPMIFYDFVGEKRDKALKELQERRQIQEMKTQDEPIEVESIENEANENPIEQKIQ